MTAFEHTSGLKLIYVVVAKVRRLTRGAETFAVWSFLVPDLELIINFIHQINRVLILTEE